MLTLTHGTDVVRLGVDLPVQRVHMPRARRVNVQPTRGGASVSLGPMDVRAISANGVLQAQTVGVMKAPPNPDYLQQLAAWQSDGARVSVTWQRPVWRTPRAWSMPDENLGFHYVTDVDPTYTNFRAGSATRVEWRLTLTPVGITGRHV